MPWGGPTPLAFPGVEPLGPGTHEPSACWGGCGAVSAFCIYFMLLFFKCPCPVPSASRFTLGCPEMGSFWVLVPHRSPEGQGWHCHWDGNGVGTGSVLGWWWQDCGQVPLSRFMP